MDRLDRALIDLGNLRDFLGDLTRERAGERRSRAEADGQPAALPRVPGSVVSDLDGDIYFQTGRGSDTWRDVNGDWVSSNWIETSILTVLFDAGAQK